MKKLSATLLFVLFLSGVIRVLNNLIQHQAHIWL